jgi:hypothetical protein
MSAHEAYMQAAREERRRQISEEYYQPTERQVIPLAEAVKAPRFSTSRHWQVSSQAREVLDEIMSEINRPLPPRPTESPEIYCENVTLEGSRIEIRATFQSLEFKRAFDAPALVEAPAPALAIVDTPAAFEPDRTAALDAAAALRVLESRARRPATRGTVPRAAPAPSPGLGWLTWLVVSGCTLGLAFTLCKVLS